MRIFLMWLLVLAAAPTRAEWVKVAEGSLAIYYVDPASIRKSTPATVRKSGEPSAARKSADAAKPRKNSDPGTTRKANDPAATRSSEGFGRAWEMQDLKQRGPDGELSMRTFSEFDCKDERSRILSVSRHPDLMAGGRIIFASDTAGQ